MVFCGFGAVKLKMSSIPKTVLLFILVLGNFPIQYNCNKDGKVYSKLSCKVFLWGLVVILFQVFGSFYALYLNCAKTIGHDVLIGMEDKTTIAAIFLDIIPLTITALVIFVSSVRKNSRFIKMYNLLEEADKVLSKEENDHALEFKLSVIFIVVTVLITLNFFVFVGFTFYTPVWTIYYSEAAFIAHFSAVTTSIGKRFIKVNNMIKHHVLTGSFLKLMKVNALPQVNIHTDITSRKSKKYFNPSNLSDFTRTYWCLCEATSEANYFYEGQLFVVIISSYLHSITSLYFSYNDFFSMPDLDSNDVKILNSWILQTLWGVFHFCCIAMLVWPSTQVSTAAGDTSKVVSQLINRDINPRLKEKLETFLLELVHQNAKFCAMGFFQVHKHILTSFAGSVTTYLVILIQFRSLF